MRHWARTKPDGVALLFTADGVSESSRLTFGELDARARRLGGRMVQAGLTGQRVLLPVASEPAFLSALCACFYAGVIAVPCPFHRRNRGQDRIRAIVRDAAIAAVIGGSDDGTAELAQAIPGVAWHSVDAEEESSGLAECDPNAPTLLQYTSGSTSAPKGVIVSQRNLAANIAMLGEAFGVHSGSRMLTWLPLFHDMGLLGNVVPALYWGIPCVVMRPLSFLQKPRRWLEAIGHYDITISGGPNFAYELCVRRLGGGVCDQLDLRSWELAFCGAEPVRLSTMQRFAQTFAAAGFRPGALYPCYGLAEATVFVSGGRLGQGVRVLPREAATARDLVSCGSAPPAGPVTIVDPETCEALPDGREGELWVRGEHVAAGYWNNPAATAATFAARIAHRREPFMRTGDLGLKWQGELYITGRRKNLIIHRGINLHPEDIEASIGACHPGFGAMGAAFSIEVDDEEQVVAVYEVLNDAAGIADAHAMTERALDAVALDHGVRLFDLVLIRAGTLPRTTSGKVQREQCRKLYVAGTLATIAGATHHSSLGRYQASAARAPSSAAT
ncbi:MAG TPA: fatty acyl-AMP ligase [Xanthobacteraceae bacterium]|nr:fatty acyl-AMP ligase [Xanthobacteraceae bacterium]